MQLCQYATGHSLGGFTATACTVLLSEIHHCVAFESPGLTRFYHQAATLVGDQPFWQVRSQRNACNQVVSELVGSSRDG